MESRGDIEDGKTEQDRCGRQSDHGDGAQPQRQQRTEIAERAVQLTEAEGEGRAPLCRHHPHYVLISALRSSML